MAENSYGVLIHFCNGASNQSNRRMERFDNSVLLCLQMIQKSFSQQVFCVASQECECDNLTTCVEACVEERKSRKKKKSNILILFFRRLRASERVTNIYLYQFSCHVSSKRRRRRQQQQRKKRYKAMMIHASICLLRVQFSDYCWANHFIYALQIVTVYSIYIDRDVVTSLSRVHCCRVLLVGHQFSFLRFDVSSTIAHTHTKCSKYTFGHSIFYCCLHKTYVIRDQCVEIKTGCTEARRLNAYILTPSVWYSLLSWLLDGISHTFYHNLH